MDFVYLYVLAPSILIPLVLLGLIVFLAFKIFKYFQDLRNQVEAIQSDLILLKAHHGITDVSSELKEEATKA